MDIKKKSTDIIFIGELPAIPSPHQRDIFLFSTYIAGTSHIENIDEIAAEFSDDEVFSFYREPDNLHDNKAIMIKNNHGDKVGYVPQADNLIFSRLMDNGKLLFGKLTNHQVRGKWHKIDIDIYLRD
ncbi:MAG: HIRAN domain-containing protein [Bacilli bacterium]|nr:HIRAN domain-containing protein [Bacilli bacterium]MDD4077060.1 HIRAN domain-containing protein [Bacilli bacterium]MDD4387847.1 HIRAN domain-containing protein [Bacilli bacterium]